MDVVLEVSHVVDCGPGGCIQHPQPAIVETSAPLISTTIQPRPSGQGPEEGKKTTIDNKKDTKNDKKDKKDN